MTTEQQAGPDFPPLPLDLDTTNPRLTLPIKAGELVTMFHRWGAQVYRQAYAAGQASRDDATPPE